jgi:glycosyltransferase involved in cell wall biosynthesis
MSEPLITAIIPTLNAERYLEECLDALLDQTWPRNRLEILIVDAGSTDETLRIARAKGVDRVLENPLKTGEAGKAVGIRAAKGDLLLSVDSDNVVIGRDWLARMAAPFGDDDVVAAEVKRFGYRRQDGIINRWHALTGVADPLTLYVGNYARDSLVTGRWTGARHKQEPRDGWDRVQLDPEAVPVLGANGFMVRRSALELVSVGDYHFDLDFVRELALLGHGTIARVDVAIRHYFCDGLARFVRKTRRRADDFFYFSSSAVPEGHRRTYPWKRQVRAGALRFIASTLLCVPVLVDAAVGARRRPDTAWLFHLPACWITLCVYGAATIRALMRPRMLDRKGWGQ